MVRARLKEVVTVIDDEGQQDPRRRIRRHRTRVVACELGAVVDLSKAGIRLACTAKPPVQVGSVLQLKLGFPKGSIIAPAQVRWLRRKGGLFKTQGYELGLQFYGLGSEATAALDSLARFGFESSSRDDGASSRNVHASVELPDYYKILGLTPLATSDQIRAAFREMSRKYHPDASRAPSSEGKFIQIQQAYQVLTDPEQRSSYDRRLAG